MVHGYIISPGAPNTSNVQLEDKKKKILVVCRAVKL